jgi:serine/threonine-protein kinase
MLNHRRYHLDRWIAAGGMGEVWQATDTLLEREVALKVLRREYAEEPLVRARFAAEARHAGALQHPNVASVLDYGEMPVEGQPPLPFLVMELVDGQPLSDLLAGGRALPALVAADYVAQAADGLEAAHAIGIVHRDVKPSNLLVTPQGRVKVTDFGVARAADSASFTLTGHLVGTPHYLSPEQADGGSATAASDVYALGIVLYECLSGRKPFVGETAVTTALMHLRDPLPPLPSTVPEQLQRIVQVATAKDPSHRFRSAAAMASALRDDSPDTRAYLVPRPASQPVKAKGFRLVGRAAGAAAAALLLVAAALWATTAVTGDGTRTPDAVADDGPVLVGVRADDYVGHPRAEAVDRLHDLQLRTRVERRTNLGGHPADTVAAVSPTGRVEQGTTVVLTVWAAPDATAPTGTGDRRGASAGGTAGPAHQGPGKGSGPGTGNGAGPASGGQGPAAGPGQQSPGGKATGKANGKGTGGPGGPGRSGGHAGHGGPAKGGKR